MKGAKGDQRTLGNAENAPLWFVVFTGNLTIIPKTIPEDAEYPLIPL
jgi:hypothetical protein